MSHFYFIKSFARTAKFHLGLSFLFCLAVAELVAQPTFVNLPTNSTIDCEDAWPSSVGVSAVSDCPGDVQVDTFVAETGNTVSSCSVSTAFGPGIDWAVWLPVLEAPSVAWNFIGTPSLEFYANGTGRLTGIIQNAANANWQMEVDVFFENGRDWTAWSALGRNYKNDFGLVGSNYLNWSYYELNSVFSHFTGIGVLEGSELSLQHMPANYYFGFQAGLAANNKNANDGLSGWFTYSGTFNGASVDGNGDINIDKACQNGESGCGSTQYTSLYRAEDACGNVAYAESRVTKVDNAAPVFGAVDSPLYVSCLDSGNTFVSATDACSEVSISFTDEVITAGCPGLVNRTYTATDGCGNQSLVSQLIYTLGEGELEFTNFPADAAISCQEASDLNPVIEYSAICINTILTQSDEIIAGSCPANYTLVRTYTLTDDCGNSVSRTWIVQVADTQAPSITEVPVSATINCGEEVPSGTPTASDNCSDFTLTSNTIVTQQECGSTTTTVWTATDACGNVSTAQQVVIVEDNNAPVFIQAPSDIELTCGIITGNGSSPIVEDDCSDVSITYSDEIVGTQPCSGSIIRHWIATDACGNVATFDQTLNFADTEAPTIFTTFETLNVDCNNVPVADMSSITFSDNCSGNESLSVSENIIPGNCSGSYSIERTYSVTDGCGNSANVLQIIIVSDNNAPVFGSIESPVIVDCSAISTVSVSVADDCSGVELTYTDEVLVEGCPGVIVRTYTATDGCGNTSQVEQIIYTVTESGTPEFTNFPQDATISCEGASALNPVVEYSAGCANTILTQSEEIIAGSCASNYTLVRTYTLTDDCGNSVSRTWTVQVADTQAPSITGVPVSASLNCGEEVPTGTPTASDNCSDFTLTSNTVVTELECGSTTTTIWTATDACGNVSTAQQVVTIDFNVNLQFSYIPASVTIACGEQFELDTAIVGQSCTNVTLSWADEPLNDCGGSYIRIWRAFDGCGNQAIESTVVTVVDEESPTLIGVPAQLQGSCGTEPVLPQVTAVDNCDTDVEVILTETTQPGNCGQVTTYTWTATDACGNNTSVSRQFAITDNQPPQIELVIDTLTASCDDDLATLNIPAPIVSDNCSQLNPVSTSDTTIPSDCGSVITRTYTATDGCGNSAQARLVIILEDTTAPVFGAVQSPVTVDCSAISTVSVSVADNCSGVELTYIDEVLVEGCPGVIVRTYTATDGCGNTSQAEQIIYTVTESGTPEFTNFPQDATISCEDASALNPVVEYSAGCANTILTQSEEIIAGSCASNYTLVRTYTLTDDCGNSVSRTWTVQVADTQAPAIAGVPASASLGCGDEVPSGTPTASDNCSDFTLTSNTVVTQLECGSTTTTIWTATDACGNVSTAQQVVTIDFNVNLQFSYIPASVTIACGEQFELDTAIVGQSCTNVTLSWADEPLNDCGGSYIRIWRAFDGCGNQAIESTVVTVVDEESPILLGVPAQLQGSCGTEPVLPQVTAVDNCDSDVEVTVTETTQPGNCGLIKTYTWTATDACGNTVIASRQLALTDNVPPQIELSIETITASCDADLAALNIPAPVVTDNCSQLNPITYSDSTIPAACGSVVIRTYTATDGCGNSAQAQLVITLEDNTAPVFVQLPANISAACGVVAANSPTPVVEDNCSDVAITFVDEALPGAACNGSILRIWTATDACGNVANAEQIITYADNVAPTITSYPEDTTVGCDLVPVADASDVTYQDNCSASIVSVNDVLIPGGCPAGYNIERTFTVTDACGNSASAMQTIYVVDEVSPVIFGMPSDTTISCGQELAITAITATDNCSTPEEITFAVEEQFFPNDCGTTLLRVYMASDACGNTTSIVQNIYIVDSSAPVFVSFPTSADVACDLVVPVEESPIDYSDDCSLVTVSWQEQIIAGDCPSNYTSVRTCTLTDGCGNSTVASYTLNVSDTQSPVLAGVPRDVTIECGESMPVANVTVWDNCTAQPQFFIAEAMETIGCVTYLTRRWTSLDECGNLSQDVQVVTIVDETAPTLSAYPQSIVLSCGQTAGAAPVLTANDGCTGLVPVVFTETPLTTGACGGLQRTWCATDCSGNEECHTQLITFQPQALPAGMNAQLEAWQTATNRIALELIADESTRWNVDLLDLNGRRIDTWFSGDMTAGETLSISADVDFLVSGIYFVQFSNGKNVITKRLPIVRN